MISGLIRWSLANRFLVLCGALLLLGWGLFAVRRVPVDAIPDLSENQVIVFAEWAGRSPQEIEDQITYPLSVNLQGLAGVRTVRASSMFGFSLITVVFEDRLDNYFARSRILERLNSLGNLLPSGVTPRLGPDATGLGWVYQYYLKDRSGRQDLGSLRALQDYFVRYQLASVSGVAEVAGIGGFVRQWQVEVSSLRMRQYGVSLPQILEALSRNNLNVGGRTLEENGQEFVVRGRGLFASGEDIGSVALASRDNVPVHVSDVATVQVGGDYRRGALDVDGREVVGGVVVMRSGANAWQVIQDVKARLAEIGRGLPPGVTIEPFYDRSDLIARAIDTLRHTLWEAVILVTLMHVIFLFHFRSILIVTLPLPASILIAFILMKEFGIQSHIMSLTGIAIAIGVLVDAAIVMTENVIRHCEAAEAAKGSRLTPAETRRQVLAASLQVGRPIFFAMGIIILAFLPVFSLSGQEGRLFHPLAWTKTFAMVGATLLAITLVPVLCTFLVRGPFQAEERNWVMRGLLAVYDPVLDWALRRRKTVLALAAALLTFCVVLAFGLPPSVASRLPPGASRLATGFGSEFMPPLDEGSLLFMPVLLPDTSLTEVQRIMAWQDRVIRETPEVAGVAGKLGRFDTPTDPAPAEMIETTITLKPAAEWRPGLTRDQLVAELTAKLTSVPGYVPGFLQPIENRVLMLSTGIRAQLGIKIFGDDPGALQQKAAAVAAVVRAIPGAAGVAPSRTQEKPYLEIAVDRAALARYGLDASTVLAVVETGLGGSVATTAIQGRERWPVQVRFERADREDLDRLGALPVALPGGRFLPLGQLASIRRTAGPDEIPSENGRLYAYVQANVSGRDLGSFVREVRQAVERGVPLDPGMTIEYAGEYENELHARQTLQTVIPVVLAVIFIVLTLAFHSPAEAAHVILAVPFALTGGVLLQWLLGYNFSVAVWIGYIALFGTAIQTGVVMVVYLKEAVARAVAEKSSRRIAGEDGPVSLTPEEFLAAVKSGARLRLRPKVMTVATVVAGLLPIFWSTRTGAEVMRPIAAPVVGGMVSSLMHILVVTPVIFLWLHERKITRAPAPTGADMGVP
ncbi:MAG TPA: CusA/CzcA family heavy metal efflux RND transporter [Opitutaceae bacterium]|nr:CusA/CzcA family heavy metal efflux RND transporter [Opitutaceae bacterium]